MTDVDSIITDLEATSGNGEYDVLNIAAAKKMRAMREELSACIYELEREGSARPHRVRRAALARKVLETAMETYVQEMHESPDATKEGGNDG